MPEDVYGVLVFVKIVPTGVSVIRRIRMGGCDIFFVLVVAHISMLFNIFLFCG